MKKTAAFALALALGCLPATGSLAQRRVIGAEPSEPAKPEAAPESSEKSEKKKGSDEASQKKAAADAERKRAEAERKRKAKAAAEEAAQKAAEEADAKAKAEAERKAKQAAAREEKKRADELAVKLKNAKKQRRFSRQDGKSLVGLVLEPGHPEAGKLSELRLEAVEKLDVPHPKFGDRRPLDQYDIVATIEEPSTGKGEPKAWRYLVHDLRAPGSYGLHHTPRLEGEHTVRVEGRAKNGEGSFSITLPLHVGTWPPPDLDEEEQRNARERGGRAAGTRRVIGAN